ncbi:hypothetical protein C0584_01680 [Candidatus Parcubacteria bacterium]|nr:MAG: hypothetical protein C0584_01680 [Candidatus Parcubacteria bacterium]
MENHIGENFYIRVECPVFIKPGSATIISFRTSEPARIIKIGQAYSEISKEEELCFIVQFDDGELLSIPRRLEKLGLLTVIGGEDFLTKKELQEYSSRNNNQTFKVKKGERSGRNSTENNRRRRD